MNSVARYLGIVVKWRRPLIVNTAILIALALALSFILPQKFTATAQILPPNDEGDIFGLSGVLGGAASGGKLGRLRAGLFSGSTTSDLLVGILTSSSVIRAVADRCSVGVYYRIRDNSPEGAEKQLREMTSVTTTDEGIVRVRVQAKNRFLAARVANAYCDELDRFLRTSNVSQGRSTRQFVERRLSDVDSALSVARESLRVFQVRHKVAMVDDETRAAVEAYAALRAQLVSKDAELAAALLSASQDNPLVLRLTAEARALREQASNIETGPSRATGYGIGFGVPFRELPDVASEFARRYLEFRVEEEAYSSLFAQYEYARIMEARDTPAITVLDRAVPPERRSFPRRAPMVSLALLVSLITTLTYAFTAEYFAQLRIARPDEYREWADVALQVKTASRLIRRRPADKRG